MFLLFNVTYITMEQKTLIVGLVMLLVGLGGGYALKSNEESTYGSKPRSAERGHMMADGTMMGQSIDQHFIVQMIPHHEGAIEMAKMALERSKRPEMLSLANDIIEAQTREINDMTSWYKEWFGSAPPEGGMGMGGRGGGMMHMGGMTGDLDDLKATSDAEFDRVFIQQMIPHHEMAVMMASMLAASTERDEMKTLADNIITSQSREIEMMRSWLVAWY